MIAIIKYKQYLLEQMDNYYSITPNDNYHSAKYDYNLFILHINSLFKHGYK